jgi:uncharacterized protein with ATP-grasp and redox domains
MFKQALNTVRIVTADPAVHMDVMRQLAAHVAAMSLDGTPAALSQPAYEVMARVTGTGDPYLKQKDQTNRTAMAILPDIAAAVAAAADPLDAALHAAAAGNIIDMGIGHSFDIERDVLAMLERPFAISAIESFRAALRPGVHVLYLGDNAGEIVFDRLLVQAMQAAGADVTFTVKSGPIINDATLTDARQVGMTELCPVIETGAADIGVNWNRVSKEFRAAVARADLILAKGHGNFETCNDRPENFFFLLKAKCDLVARELGVTLGDMVFKHSPAASAA